MVDTESGGAIDFTTLVVTFIVGATVLVLVYISALFKTQKEKKTREADPLSAEKHHHEGAGGGGSLKPPSKKKQHHQPEKWSRDSKQTFSHPWLLTSLKGHGGHVLDMDFSSNGKFLATCAEDRAVFIWSTKDWGSREHKSVRYNVELDHASHVCWSPDSKAFILNRAAENCVEVCKITRKTDGWIASVSKASSFPKVHKEELVGLGIAVSGRYLMTCGTELILWDLKGTELATVDTYLMNNYCARISPCGRFVAVSGFAPDVKVWEVVFHKTGEFKQILRVFELKGHSSGVFDFGFSADSSRMATVSKDCTWKLYDTNVEYTKGEDPHLLLTGHYKPAPKATIARLALSPNGEVVVIATGNKLYFFSALTGLCDKAIHDVYTGVITCVVFDSAGEYVLTGGEKHVRVLQNVTGRRTAIMAAKAKLQSSSITAATKERLQGIITDAEGFLKSLGEPVHNEE